MEKILRPDGILHLMLQPFPHPSSKNALKTYYSCNIALEILWTFHRHSHNLSPPPHGIYLDILKPKLWPWLWSCRKQCNVTLSFYTVNFKLFFFDGLFCLALNVLYFYYHKAVSSIKCPSKLCWVLNSPLTISTSKAFKMQRYFFNSFF